MSDIKLSDHFTYRRLIRFTLPTIGMMIFTSVYGVVDGLFVSNFVGSLAFAAINLVMPVIMIISGLGFMIGTGGAAIVSKTFGEGDPARANRYFSMLIYVTIGAGLAIGLIGLFVVKPIAMAMGAEGEMLHYCVLYGRIAVGTIVCYLLQNVFQSFMIVAERPKMGFRVTLIAGCTNIVLDALFIAVFHWGVVGAAVATLAGEMFGGLFPLIYFWRKNPTTLKIGSCKWEPRVVGKTCVNGLSEFMGEASMSLVNMLYNLQLMKFIGPDGVAAYGVMGYLGFIFVAIFFGYGMGAGPIISYAYGAEDHGEMQNVFKKSLKLTGITGMSLLVIAEVLTPALAYIFVGYDYGLYELTKHGLRIFVVSLPLAGFTIFGSAFFTALNNGIISAIISFFRTLVCQAGAVMLLPKIFGVDGIWYSLVVAEIVAITMTTIFLITLEKRYHYWEG